jgi:glycosyltransferase involved in cell wall biosynthesis
MKICLLSYRGNPYCGGQGIYVMYLARELVKLGHEVHLISGPPHPFDVEGVVMHKVENENYFNNKDFIDMERPFVTFAPLNFYEFVASKMGIFPEIEAFSFRVFYKLRELLKTHSFDIIHDNQCLGYGFLLIKLLGVPFVSTIHHPLTIDRATWFEYPSDFLLKIKRILYYPLMMQKIVSNRMDKIITVSHDSAVEISSAFDIKPNHIKVVYNGLDSGMFYPVQGVKKIPGRIIFVGNVEDRKKGVIYLLKAMTLTKTKVTLTIVDGGAPNRKYIPRLIERYNLHDRVTFTGKITVDEMIRYYAESMIAINPSLYEGFGFPAAEAMACGIPVIASTAGALPEVVGEHLKTAYLVPPRDPEAIAAGIDYLFDNPDVLKKLASSGRDRVLKIFTWENAAKETADVYKEVINAYS